MPLHIFKSGTHTDMRGRTIKFSESDLQACADAYDPALHEAPLVIGHPRHDAPSWGWVKSLSPSGDDLQAETHQVDAQFAELVSKGRYKKISASFYQPDTPNNPVPGVYYLRHVGFLGAQPPAVKGLKPIEFSEQEEGVVEFADWGLSTSAGMFARLRDFLISKFSLDEADNVLPSWQIDALRDEAQRTEVKTTDPAFSEPQPDPKEKSVTEEEIKAMCEENARLKTDAADRAKADIKRRADELHATNVSFAEELVTGGRLTPAAKGVVVALLDEVNKGDAPVEFAEGDVKKPLATAFKELLTGAAPVLDFGEVASKDRANRDAVRTVDFADADPEQLAVHNKAVALAKAEGISYEAAVKRCL
ncbi:peptidase [Escherichia albertii]|uniref:peptidase n=1 Tax=Escherichia albertii TaxID=208962 RepID=UPI0019568AF1|nr:peptidase [Escherichia albertii]QST27730.1 peptidase [Escherichia albertii]QST37097.1 peptidase [Escherichia albertii]